MPKHVLHLLQESIKNLLSAHDIGIIDFYSRIKANNSVQKKSAKAGDYFDYLGVRLILNS